MAKYVFVYSVDAVTVSGNLTGACMILDHPELHDTIREINKLNGHVIGVNVAMYDGAGRKVHERDITFLFNRSE